MAEGNPLVVIDAPAVRVLVSPTPDAVVAEVVVVIAVLVTFRRDVSMPEREKAADEEAKGSDDERKEDCNEKEPDLAMELRGAPDEGEGERSLTERPPGGWTC